MRLRTIETFGLGQVKIGGSEETFVSLNIAQGSVIDFEAPSNMNTVQHTEQQADGIAALVAKAAPRKAEKKPSNAISPGGIAALTAQAAEKSPASHQDSSTRVGAIVNAANETCLGGGGVDGAISNAGGYKLRKDREALPLLSDHEVRCHTGNAVITGPNHYGSLRVNYVVHAVGPAYFRFTNQSDREDSDESDSDMDVDPSNEFLKPDALLRSAYQESLERCRENNVTDVAFSLLSAGVFRGKRSLNDVLSIGVKAIRDWVAQQEKTNSESAINENSGDEVSCSPYQLKSVTLCGFSMTEVITLKKVCRHIFENTDTERE